MKKYTTASAKGFTLVELIVVIVILAILATIAFLSFSSQSASARDSKRKTDLSNIASKINIGAANGSALTSFVTTGAAKLTTGELAGTGISVGGTYDAGDINFNMLGVNAADFKDPQTGTYKIGATSKAGGVFQLASKIENDENGNTTTSGAFLVGNYSARTSTALVTGATASTGSSNATITLPSSQVGYFKSGDYISYNAIVYKVDSVSADQSKVTTSSTGWATIAATAGVGTKLASAEVDSLIGNNNVPVKNGSVTPY